MADSSELKHMVMSFRVSELQVLLGFAGKNKSGRKQELMHRALALVEKGCAMPIQIKIKELYRRRFPPKRVASPLVNHSMKPPPPSQSTGASNHAGVSPKCAGLSSGYGPYSGNHPLGKYRGAPMPGHPNPNTRSHGSTVLDYKHGTTSSSSPHNQVPVHPDVRFKRLPFYDILGELLKPSSLVPRSQSRFQETFFIFHLTPQQAQDVAMSRDTLPGGRVEYTVQVQLRFCLLETSCEQEDNFPPSICVRVNGKMAPLPNPIPTNKPGVEPKRPSRPVNITAICRISPTVPNHINISWASELGRSYCVAVYLVRRLNADNLLQRLKQNGIRHPDHTRALIKEKLAHDPDSEIATTSLRISLVCPLGKMRMTIPSRASSCNHLQCFDAPMYLQMNEKKPTWVCPVCDKAAEFDKLIIDGLFTEIIRRASDCNEIKCTEDGEWHPMRVKEEEEQDIDDPVTIQTIGDSPKKQEVEDLIDLTETDDEEDDDSDTHDMDIKSVSLTSLSSDSSSGTDEPSSPDTVISTTAATACGSSKGYGGRAGSNVSTGCSSPIFCLDTPPQLHSNTPPSAPRSPQRVSTPLSSHRHSPYSPSPLSPMTLSHRHVPKSPLHSIQSRFSPSSHSMSPPILHHQSVTPPSFHHHSMTPPSLLPPITPPSLRRSTSPPALHHAFTPPLARQQPPSPMQPPPAHSHSAVIATPPPPLAHAHSHSHYQPPLSIPSSLSSFFPPSLGPAALGHPSLGHPPLGFYSGLESSDNDSPEVEDFINIMSSMSSLASGFNPPLLPNYPYPLPLTSNPMEPHDDPLGLTLHAASASDLSSTGLSGVTKTEGGPHSASYPM